MLSHPLYTLCNYSTSSSLPLPPFSPSPTSKLLSLPLSVFFLFHFFPFHHLTPTILLKFYHKKGTICNKTLIPHLSAIPLIRKTRSLPPHLFRLTLILDKGILYISCIKASTTSEKIRVGRHRRSRGRYK